MKRIGIFPNSRRAKGAALTAKMRGLEAEDPFALREQLLEVIT